MNGSQSASVDVRNRGVSRAPGGERMTSAVRAFDRWLVGRLIKGLPGADVGVALWDAETLAPAAGGGSVARLVLHDRAALYRLALDPVFQFGELYSEGRLAVEGDLVGFLEAVYRAFPTTAGMLDRLRGWFARARGVTRSRSRASIYHHYDIGNKFYRLWLDERMVYTCAYFTVPGATLEAAQFAKMEHICRKLRLRPGESVIEAGCGWGALALHMAREHGVRVRAFNISREQVAWARDRAAREGLADRVEFIEDDYRGITGACDAFVSVGMLEHVGPRNYRELGRVIDRCLSPAGRGLLHFIGRNRPTPPDRWIASRIFPAGYVPALSEAAGVLEPFGFSVLDMENLRLHYARTLAHWLERFEAHGGEIRAMFDERFVRMWRLYLAGSLAAFTTGWMQLFQVVFARPARNDIPLTRGHLHEPGL